MNKEIKVKKPLKKFIQLTELDKTKGWLDVAVGRVIPYDQLTDTQLKQAVMDAEGKQLRHHNKSVFFAMHAEKLLDEADRRGLEVVHLNTEFTVNNVISHEKNKLSSDEQES